VVPAATVLPAGAVLPDEPVLGVLPDDGFGVDGRGVDVAGGLVVVAGGVVGRSLSAAELSAGDICKSRLRLSAEA
jgi:hypothetical protein